jgi:DNA-binding transcriptional LysR family regulator
MNRNHVALFRAVAAAGGFSHAAKDIHVSQPALSMQIAELKESLGTALFDRLPRGVQLTEAGATLYSYARRIAALETEAERALDELRGLQRGRLALGASTTIGSYLLPALLGEFRRNHPAVAIELTIANTEEIKHRLEDRTLDIGLTEGVLPESAELSVRVFYEDELIVVAPPEHPLVVTNRRGSKKEITVRQFCTYPMIMREQGSGTRAVAERALAARGVALMNIALTLSSTEAIKGAVTAGLGLAIVSRLSVSLELRNGLLVECPIRDLAMRRPLHQLTLRSRQPSASSEVFSKLILKGLI